jgi:hypothetical protein
LAISAFNQKHIFKLYRKQLNPFSPALLIHPDVPSLLVFPIQPRVRQRLGQQAVPAAPVLLFLLLLLSWLEPLSLPVLQQ